MPVQIALLRGINVGGNNKIKMAELRQALTEAGLERVQTYIQSGNILFDSQETEPALRSLIEQTIRDRFGLSIPVILRSAEAITRIAADCPFTEAQIAEAESGAQGEVLYVAMLLAEPAPERLEKLEAVRTPEERYSLAGNNLYLLFHPTMRNSKLAVQADKLGVLTTVRNWKTIHKLVELAEEMAKQA